MKVLIDTQIFLWLMSEPEKLSAKAKAILEDESNQLFISMASPWEIAIKTRIGKLSIDGDFNKLLPEQLNKGQISILEIKFEHIARILSLTAHHKDPFDHLIIAQALYENMPIITSDEAFNAYAVERIWA